MNNFLKYVQKLIDYPDDRIFAFQDVPGSISGDYIVVKESETKIKSRLLNFDAEAEREYFSICNSSRYELCFYGSLVRQTIDTYSAMQLSQFSRELQRQFSLTVYRCTGAHFIEPEDGRENYWRIDVVCDYTTLVDIETRRIDELQIEFKGESL